MKSSAKCLLWSLLFVLFLLLRMDLEQTLKPTSLAVADKIAKILEVYTTVVFGTVFRVMTQRMKKR